MKQCKKLEKKSSTNVWKREWIQHGLHTCAPPNKQRSAVTKGMVKNSIFHQPPRSQKSSLGVIRCSGKGSLWIHYFGGFPRNLTYIPNMMIWNMYLRLQIYGNFEYSIYVKFLGIIIQPSIGWSLCRLASNKENLVASFSSAEGFKPA